MVIPMVTLSYIPFFQSSKYAETIRNPSPSDPNGSPPLGSPRSKILLVLTRRGGFHFGHIEVFHLSATHLRREKKWRIYTEITWIFVDFCGFMIFM